MVDLCQPSARKYETAVSVVLGRNIDAIVVDEEKIAIDCIEVPTKKLLSPHSDPLIFANSTCGTNVQAKRRLSRSTLSK